MEPTKESLNLLLSGIIYDHEEPQELINALSKLGVDISYFSDNEFRAFAAAVEYFGDCEPSNGVIAFKLAANLIATGKRYYTFYPDVDTWDALGEKVFDNATCRCFSFYRCLPEWFNDYFNYEQLGKDYEGDTGGKFTHYGFFAEKGDY